MSSLIPLLQLKNTPQGERYCSITDLNGREQTRIYLLCRQVALKQRPIEVCHTGATPDPKEITNQVSHSSTGEKEKPEMLLKWKSLLVKTLIFSLTSTWILFSLLIRLLGSQRCACTSKGEKDQSPKEPIVIWVVAQDSRSKGGTFQNKSRTTIK